MNFPDWRKIVADIEQRDPRERLVLLVLLIAVLGYAWLILVRDPIVQARQQTERELAAVETQIEEQIDRYAEIQNSYEEDPNAFARNRLRDLQERIVAVDERLEELYGQLITPRQMATVLTSILQRETSLQLVSLENLPPEAMITASAAVATPLAGSRNPNVAAGEFQLFRHGIRLVLRGSFLDTIGYLRSLEELESSFFWDELTFELLDHPEGRVQLNIFTLSTQREWIGV